MKIISLATWILQDGKQNSKYNSNDLDLLTCLYNKLDVHSMLALLLEGVCVCVCMRARVHACVCDHSELLDFYCTKH